MKAKLIKTNEGYHLKSQIKDIPKGINVYNKINDNEGLFGFGGHTGKLSLKNCQAIENGYDLDELTKADADLRYNQPGEEDLWLTRVTGIEYGFNLALELLGDKKFSEDDLDKVIEMSHDIRYITYSTDDIIQSLQQTEWQVEVIMDRIPADLAPGGWDVFPKLDAENCLILKRVE